MKNLSLTAVLLSLTIVATTQAHATHNQIAARSLKVKSNVKAGLIGLL